MAEQLVQNYRIEALAAVESLAAQVGDYRVPEIVEHPVGHDRAAVSGDLGVERPLDPVGIVDFPPAVGREHIFTPREARACGENVERSLGQRDHMPCGGLGPFGTEFNCLETGVAFDDLGPS